MSHICSELHKILLNSTRHQFPFDERQIPQNGIYIIFEKGELGHQFDRIVLVGTHTGNNQLRSRLKQHFVHENKDRSILRKNIGRCHLHRTNDPYLGIWELDRTTTEAKTKYSALINPIFQSEIERRVSEYIQNNFSFCIIEVNNKEDRLYLKSRLISTVYSCNECTPSSQWLGSFSPKEKIKNSGLWQVNELYKEPLTSNDLNRLVGLIR